MKLNLPFIKQDDSSSYKVRELEAENLKLKDDLIDQLKKRIIELEMLLSSKLDIPSNFTPEFVPPRGYSIPKEWNNKPRIRTATELSMLMEEKSRKKLEGVKRAEEPLPDTVG